MGPIMYQITSTQWAKRLHYRSEYLGWFVASILFAILCHLLLVVGIVGVGLELIQPYALMFLGGLSFMSITAFAYFATRMLAPVESLRAFFETKRRIVIGILVGCFVVLQIGSVIAIFHLGIPEATLGPVAWALFLFYYFLAIIAGYDSARTQDAKVRLKASSSHESDGSPLYEVVRGRSKRKTLAVATGLSLIFVVVGLFTSVIEGLSVTGSIAGVLAFVVQLYPKDD